MLIKLLGTSGVCFTLLSLTINMLVPTLHSRGTILHLLVIGEVPGVIPSILEWFAK